MSDFWLYKPIFEGLRKKSRLSLMSNFFRKIRRLTLLYFAMFMADYSWLQVMVFTALSVAFIAYLGFTHPLKSQREGGGGPANEPARRKGASEEEPARRRQRGGEGLAGRRS